MPGHERRPVVSDDILQEGGKDPRDLKIDRTEPGQEQVARHTGRVHGQPVVSSQGQGAAMTGLLDVLQTLNFEVKPVVNNEGLWTHSAEELHPDTPQITVNVSERRGVLKTVHVDLFTDKSLFGRQNDTT